MAPRRTRNSLASQEDVSFVQDINLGPNSSSPNREDPVSVGEELESHQVQGDPQVLSPPDQPPIDRSELHFKKLELSLNLITERLTRLEDRDQNRASHSRSRSRISHTRSPSRSRYSNSPLSHRPRENSRARARYSPRESHSRSPVSSHHRRESRHFSLHYSPSRSHSDRPHRSRNFWGSPSNSRKRKRSESSDYSSESSEVSQSHFPRGKRRISSPSEEDDSFLHKGETYIRFTRGKHKHVKGDSSQIFWGKELISVKWFKDGPFKAFCPIKSKSTSSPYMDRSTACSHLEEFLNLVPLTGENLGLKRTAYSVPFGTDSGLGKAFDLFGHSIEGKVTHALLDKNKKAALKAFSDSHFDSPAILTFSKDWPKGDLYLDWAKGHLLDYEDLARDLDVSKINKNNLTDLLEEEKDTRNILVNNITGLRALELLAENLKGDSSSQSTTLAIASLFLSNLKPLIVNWMDSKMKLRKSILHNQDSHAVRLLLKSDMWSPNIFPKSALEEAEKTKKFSGLRNILNLNNDGSLKKFSDFSKKGNLNSSHKKSHDFEGSRSRRTQFHSRKREFRHNYPSKDSFRPHRDSNQPNQNKSPKAQSSDPSAKPPQKSNFKGRAKPSK